MLRCFSCSKTVLVFWICSFSVIHSLTCTANSCKPSSSLQIVRLTTHWTRRNEKKKLILPKICCHNAMWCHPTGRSIGQSITLRHAFPLSGDNAVFLTKDAGIAAVMTLQSREASEEPTNTNFLDHVSLAPESAGPSHGFKRGAVLCSTCCSSTKSDSAWIKHKGSVKYMPTSGWQQNGRWHPPH